MMMVCYGLVASTSGFLIPQLEDSNVGFGISLEEGSWLASILVLGSQSGALFGGVQCGMLGRKRSMMIDCLLFILGTLLVCLSPNFYLILIGRYVQGHSGASSMVAVPVYVGEISQPQVRKLTGSFAVTFYTCGFAIALILGTFVNSQCSSKTLTDLFSSRSFATLEMGSRRYHFRSHCLFPNFAILSRNSHLVHFQRS